MTAELLNHYTEICRVAIKSSSAKLGKTFENLLLEIILLNMAIQRKINFTQMERYGTHCQARTKISWTSPTTPYSHHRMWQR